MLTTMRQINQIIAPKNTLKKNKSYLLIDYSTGKRQMYPVIFTNECRDNGTFSLTVKDMLTGKQYNLFVDNKVSRWFLLDIAYDLKNQDYLAILSYCGYCKNALALSAKNQ